MKEILYNSLIVSVALFFILGLPFLTRYTLWIPIVARAILVYCVLFVVSFVGVGIYNFVK